MTNTTAATTATKKVKIKNLTTGKIYTLTIEKAKERIEVWMQADREMIRFIKTGEITPKEAKQIEKLYENLTKYKKIF